MQHYTTYWIMYRGLRHYLGKWKNKAIHVAFLRWQAANGWPKHCALCGKRVTSGQRSLDHIIPQSVCIELDLIGLIFDSRNFRMTHRACNARRGSRLDTLPMSIQKALRDRRLRVKDVPIQQGYIVP